MLACVGLRHQQFDVASDQLFRHIAEEPLSRLIDRPDRAVPVDYDDSIDRGIDDRAVERVGETFATLVLQPRRRRTQLPDPSNAFLKGPYKATASPNLPLALQVSQMSRGAEPPTERRHRSQRRLISSVSIVSPAVDTSLMTSWRSRMRIQAIAMAVLRSAAGA